MTEPKAWAVGDPCPGCGGSLRPQRRPTAAEAKAFTDSENPRALPPGVDSASDEQHAELGDLHRCADCGYAARVPRPAKKARPTEPADAVPAPAAAPRPAKKRKAAAKAAE